jgi:hypothetical protein
MKNLLFIGLVCCSFVAKAQPNLILNGSFELNNSTECFNEFIFINEYNTTLQYSIDYGSNTSLVLMKGSCLVCSPPVYWGGGVQEGNHMLYMLGHKEILSDGSIYRRQGEVSLELDFPLAEEKNYKLSFWVKDPPPTPNIITCSDPLNNYISVGISNTDDAFGTHLITSPYGDTLWQQYSVVFNTQNAEEYITVKVGVNDTIDYAVLIDNFVLVETEEQPNAIFELNTNTKQLLKIVDILGKESTPNKKGLLFYIYSDGTVEKKLIIE